MTRKWLTWDSAGLSQSLLIRSFARTNIKVLADLLNELKSQSLLIRSFARMETKTKKEKDMLLSRNPF